MLYDIKIEDLNDDFSVCEAIDESLLCSEYNSYFAQKEIIPDAINDYLEEYKLRNTVHVIEVLNASKKSFDAVQLDRVKHKIVILMESLGWGYDKLRDNCKVDDFVDNSIVFRFSQRKDIRMNLYFDESAATDSQEECYLSYKKKGIRCIESGSIIDIVDILKSML